jgi:copper resistance protein B
MESDEMDHTQHMDSSGNMNHPEHMDQQEQTMDSDEMAPDEMAPDEMDHTGHTTDPAEADHSDHSEEMVHSQHTMDAGQTDQAGAVAPVVMGTGTEELRDPHAYAEGEDFGPLGRPHLLDEKHFGAVLIDRLESVHSEDNSWLAFSGQAWYGGTYNRANLKLELEADSGTVEHSRTELLWSHAVASFWDTQLGVRFDSGETPDRTWAAFGVQGIAPYWFHLDATLYAGEHGDTAARLEADYELLFTQRLILQPRLETNLYGQNDVETGTGSGLSDLTVGLRLRYEFTRQFAPYVGIQWAGLYGGAADYAREDNLPTEVTSWVIGLHMWF